MLKNSKKSDSAKIKRFATLWLCGIAAVFVFVSVALFVSTSMLHASARRIFTDSRSLEADHLFELKILTQRGEDLLWRITKDPRHDLNSKSELSDADNLIGNLRVDVTSNLELAKLNDVEAKYQRFRRAALSQPAQDPAVLAKPFDELLEAVHRHRAVNTKQMEETISYSNRLNKIANLVSIALIFLMALGLGGGGLAFWSKIFRPTLLLAQAAKAFGEGDLSARAPVLRNDEMGALNRTFNNMADAVRHRQQERRDFVAIVAHDIRTPLGNVTMAAQMLTGWELPSKERRLMMTRLIKNARRAQSILDDLLDCTQAEAGQIALEREEFDLTALVRDLVCEQKELCLGHLLNFQGKEECLISGDRERLGRVVLNLLSNGIKYSSPGCPITVKVEALGTNCVISVEDRGVGIAEENLEQIFFPFTRLDSTSRMARGTGIGLTSVRKIVEAHGGSIEVMSELGVGSTIKVILPVSVAATGKIYAKSAN